MNEQLRALIDLVKRSPSRQTFEQLDKLLEQGAPWDGADDLYEPVVWCLRFDHLEYLVRLVDHDADLRPDMIATAYAEQSFKCLKYLCDQLDCRYLGSGTPLERLERLAEDFGTHCADKTSEYGYHSELLEQDIAPERVLELIPAQEWDGTGGAWGYNDRLITALEQLTDDEGQELADRFPDREQLSAHCFAIFKQRWLEFMRQPVMSYGG